MNADKVQEFLKDYFGWDDYSPTHLLYPDLEDEITPTHRLDWWEDMGALVKFFKLHKAEEFLGKYSEDWWLDGETELGDIVDIYLLSLKETT